MAERQPLVLAVENLQWSDATAEEWLASLVERLPGAALLLMATYRPGYQPPWGAHSAAAQLALPPLRPRHSCAVVQAIPRSMQPPEVFLQEIVAKAGGNPLFLLAMAYEGAGLLSFRQEDLHQAITVLERGLDLCRSRNLENWFYGLAWALGYAYALSRCLSEALPLLEQVVEQGAAMRGGRPLSTRVLRQSDAYLLAGRVEEARDLALQALDLVRLLNGQAADVLNGVNAPHLPRGHPSPGYTQH